MSFRSAIGSQCQDGCCATQPATCHKALSSASRSVAPWRICCAFMPRTAQARRPKSSREIVGKSVDKSVGESVDMRNPGISW